MLRGQLQLQQGGQIGRLLRGSRGNCRNNAVVESFFQLLKRERIRRRIYATRDEAGQDAFNYIEMFYSPVGRHSYSNRL